MNKSLYKGSPLLSISLLVSNRVDTIRKCMESLRTLMDSVPSELIAVDTGGTDGSIDIVREYTDKIIAFPWCDDFAAARNAGLMRAKGEWFLYLDDDEWFENTDEIQVFFQSGEYKSYSSACYMVNNYIADGTESKSYVGRMCRRTSNTRFTGSIHEVLEPLETPMKYFRSFVHHYGYYYSSAEEQQKHFERNVRLLKQELRKNPTNVRYLCQLAQEYETVEDFINEESVCRLAVNNIHSSGRVISTAVNWMMAALIRVLSCQNRPKDALKEGRKMLDRGYPYELSQAVILAYMVEESLSIKEYQNAINYCKEFSYLVDYLGNNFDLVNWQSMLSMTYSYVMTLYKTVMSEGLEACCAVIDFTEAEIFLKWLFDDEKNTAIEQTCSFVEQLKVKYPGAVSELKAALASMDNLQNPYLSVQRLLACKNTKKDDIQYVYDNCVRLCIEKKKFYGQLLYIAGKYKLNHTVMLETLERNEWEDWLSASFPYLEINSFSGIKQGLINTCGGDRIKYLSFAATLERQLLIFYTEDFRKQDDRNTVFQYKQYKETLEDYCYEGLQYFRKIYRKEVFDEEDGINLPKECRFLLSVDNALSLETTKDITGCLNEVKKAIQIHPAMVETLKAYIVWLEQEIAYVPTDEFNTLGLKIKNEANNLIQIQKYEEVIPILKQLMELLPEDMEIRSMLKKAYEEMHS